MIVVEAVISHLKAEEEIGPYEAAVRAGQSATTIYKAAAQLIGCSESEIAFCDSASRAWNSLIYSLRLAPGDRILVSPLEFGSCLIALQHVAERAGAKVEVLPSDGHGRVLLHDAERAIVENPPALIAVTHAAAHCGSVNPVREIGEIARRVRAFYVVDACQSIGQMPVSVESLNCDALTATGRKWLRGPRGTGFLYVRDRSSESIDPITTDLVTAEYLPDVDPITRSRLSIRRDARKFELWERSVAGAIGLGVAIEYLLKLITEGDGIFERILSLAQYTADKLRTLEGVEVWAPARVESGVVGFTVRGQDVAAIKAACSREGINISTMSEWDAPLDFPRRKAKTACRVAPHYFNDSVEVDRFLEVVRACTLHRSTIPGSAS